MSAEVFLIDASSNLPSTKTKPCGTVAHRVSLSGRSLTLTRQGQCERSPSQNQGALTVWKRIFQKSTNQHHTKNCYVAVWDLSVSHFSTNRWIAFSCRLRRLVILYSDREYDHRILVQPDHEIVSFCEQPLRMRVRLPFGIVTTVFNVGVREVKHSIEIEKPRTTLQIEAQSDWCRLKLADYELYDDHSRRVNSEHSAGSNQTCRKVEGFRSRPRNQRLKEKKGRSDESLWDSEKSQTEAVSGRVLGNSQASRNRKQSGMRANWRRIICTFWSSILLMLWR
jgi:hypothetical protein